MVVGEGEKNSQGEVESALQREEEGNKKHPLLRQSSSIYSLTLDEFQHTLCGSGKNFGSMNMDEFLTSIWNAEFEEDNQPNNNNLSLTQTCRDKGTIKKQPSLPRQPSLTLPPPLCRKTVEQVWSEIHKEHQCQQQQQNQSTNNSSNNIQNTESAPSQPTFGEMTLEDFLVKAGVVREPCALHPAPPASHQQQQQQQYGVYTNNNSTMPPSYVGTGRPVVGIGGGGVRNVVAPPYTAVAQGGGDPSSGCAGNGKRDSTSGYPPPPPGVCFGGGVYGVAVAPPTIGMGAPVSPASSTENSGGQFGVDIRGRKRMVDGPVEKVVERRQRRMIKNRESAARSRARKQAYTVDLEAELNILREENAQLKQALAELERRRKQQCFEEVSVRVQTKAQKAKDKLSALRRNLSCPL